MAKSKGWLGVSKPLTRPTVWCTVSYGCRPAWLRIPVIGSGGPGASRSKNLIIVIIVMEDEAARSGMSGVIPLASWRSACALRPIYLSLERRHPTKLLPHAELEFRNHGLGPS